MKRTSMTPHDQGQPTLCECDCHAHPPGWIKHVVACCSQCPKCGRFFSAGFAEHREQCGD
jgi:hypothetical protein